MGDKSPKDKQKQKKQHDKKMQEQAKHHQQKMAQQKHQGPAPDANQKGNQTQDSYKKAG